MSSELYELCITNAGSHLKKNQLERWLTEAGVQGVKWVDKRMLDAFGYVGFNTAEDMNAAEALMLTKKLKDRKPSIKRSSRRPPQWIIDGKPPPDLRDGQPTARPSAPTQSVNDATAPWAAVAYAEQLSRKQADMENALKSITLKLIQHCTRREDERPDDDEGDDKAGSAAEAAAAGQSSSDDKAEGAPSSKRQRTENWSSNAGTRTEAWTGAAASGGQAWRPATIAALKAQQAQPQAQQAAGAQAPSGASSAAAAAIEPAAATSSEGAGAPSDTADASAATAAADTAAAPAPAAPASSSAASSSGAAASNALAKDQRLPGWMRGVLTKHISNGGAAHANARNASAMPIPCPLLPIVPSPVTNGYRNKANFTIGRDGSGAPTVGFRVASFQESIAVEFPSDSQPLLPREMIVVARAVQDWLRSSPLPPYDQALHTGVWRSLLLRWSNATRSMMVALTAAPPQADTAAAAAADASSSSGSAVPEAAAGASSAAAAAAQPTAEAYQQEVQRFVQALAAVGQDVADSSGGASTEGPGSSPSTAPFTVTSVMLQEYNGRSTPDPNQHPYKPLSGASVLSEGVCGKSFNVSPNAFFQVNSKAAEVLYSIARLLALEGMNGIALLQGMAGQPAATATATTGSTAQEAASAASQASASHEARLASILALPVPSRPNVAIADVCCGTGTIGLVCAPYVGRVVGVELAADAVADAKVNAQLNNTANAVFIAAKAEAVMKDILTIAEKGTSSNAGAAGASGAAGAGADAAGMGEGAGASSSGSSSAAPSASISRVVAIVDPPRGGLNPSVILALRTCHALKRVVYVSCNPTGTFVDDAMKLCAPQEGKRKSAYARGPAFTLKACIPLDLFPHTPHTEMVGLFERD